MKKEALIIGEVYYSYYGHGWILKYTGEGTKYLEFISICIFASGKADFHPKGSWGLIEDFNYQGKAARLATYEEKQWLETCEKAGKYIPLEECRFINFCEIY